MQSIIGWPPPHFSRWIRHWSLKLQTRTTRVSVSRKNDAWQPLESWPTCGHEKTLFLNFGLSEIFLPKMPNMAVKHPFWKIGTKLKFWAPAMPSVGIFQLSVGILTSCLAYFLTHNLFYFYARKQLLLSARLSHRNSVRPSVCLSVTRVDQSKSVQDRITKSSPSAAWKTLVLGTVKLFYKFEKGHFEQGR